VLFDIYLQVRQLPISEITNIKISVALSWKVLPVVLSWRVLSDNHIINIRKFSVFPISLVKSFFLYLLTANRRNQSKTAEEEVGRKLKEKTYHMYINFSAKGQHCIGWICHSTDVSELAREKHHHNGQLLYRTHHDAWLLCWILKDMRKVKWKSFVIKILATISSQATQVIEGEGQIAFEVWPEF